MPEIPETDRPAAVPAKEVRGILPKQPDPTKPVLPPRLEQVISDAGRAKGVKKTPYGGSSFS